jgi:type IV pilus assembly protein PilM
MSVGLDIGSKTIKVVELDKSGNRFNLKAAGLVGYTGSDLAKMTDEKEIAQMADVLRKVFSDAKISAKEVTIALPEPQVFTRAIRFPLLTDQEISSAVKWEAEQYIPIPLNEAVIQHQIIERRETTSPPEVLVLLVAAPRVLVEKYVQVVSAAKFTVVGVETELIALARSLGPPDQTVVILDFGAGSTDLAIVKNGSLVFSRSIATAGEAFTRAVGQSLGITPQQAEEYKKTYGLAAAQLEGKVRGALDPILRVVGEEIKKAIHFYQSENKNNAPTSLIISGGSSGMREVAPYLTKYLGLEVVMGNPFSKVSLDAATSQSLAPYAPLYAIAVGLAMKP